MPQIIARQNCILIKYFNLATNSLVKTLAYIRPTIRDRRVSQERDVAEYSPDQIWAYPDHTPDDVIMMMRRPGRVLVVPGIDTIAGRRADRNRVIDEVLAAGCDIVVARDGVTIKPEDRDVVLVALGARRRDIAPEDAARAGREGGERGYDMDTRNECIRLWKSGASNDQIKSATGVDPSSVYRWCVLERKQMDLPPISRPRGPGRPRNDERAG